LLALGNQRLSPQAEANGFSKGEMRLVREGSCPTSATLERGSRLVREEASDFPEGHPGPRRTRAP